MVDTSRNVNPGTQAMPIGFDFPPKMATLPAAETVQGGIQPGSVAAVAILTGRANKTEA